MNERARLYAPGLHSTPCGSAYRKKYVKDHTTNPPTLREVGKTDQQSLIDSYRDECDVNKIVARYLAGDSSVLQRVQGIYTDTTGVPTDPVEAMNLGNLARTAWDNLTDEQKAVFGDADSFAEAILTGNMPQNSDNSDNSESTDNDFDSKGGETE